MLKKFLILFAYSVLSLASSAEDTYDGTILTIPKVALGQTLYRDVKITVGQVLRVDGGNPRQDYDVYEASSNVLNIGSVKVGPINYTNVAVKVGQILAVGDSGPLDPLKWSLTSLVDAGEIDMSVYAPMAPNQNGHYDLLATGDLNGDGHDDLLIAPKVWDVFTPYVKLVVAFYNPKSKKFEVDPSLQTRMPTMQWGQKAKIGDFNGDGYGDIFVVGTGPDQGQPCGEAPVLMLGSKDGLKDASDMLPRVSGYTHQMAFADFNGDGKTDFVILNNQWVPWSDQDARISACTYRRFPGSGKSFLVLSNSTGWKAQEIEINSEIGLLIGGTDGLSYSSAFAGDFDGDGKIDEYFAHRQCEHVWGDADGDGDEECLKCGKIKDIV